MMNKQQIIQKTLRFFARKILKKYKPRVVGITGSVGKSTAKEMIFSVLSGADFDVRKSEKNYNNEIGIPLAIIGAPGEKKNIMGWLGVFLKAVKLIMLAGKYPKILVLELAVDYPGDMKYFCEFIPVDVGVLTSVGISHLENFGTQEAIFEEKSYLLKQAKELSVYNQDSVDNKIQEKLSGKITTYGFEKGDFRILEIGYSYNRKNILSGMIFKVENGGKIISGKLNNLIGRPALYGVLAALGVAGHFGIAPQEALASVENLQAIPGHMSLLKGIKNTSIIDDTYNSAPASVNEALAVIEKIDVDRKIVVLGDMLELGREEEVAHQAIGRRVARIENVIFVTVGERMKLAREEFQKEIGDETKSYWFEGSVKAGRAVQNLMQQGDLMLVKGSQGVRMEKIVVEIMAEPKRKKELIVRQDKDWI